MILATHNSLSYCPPKNKWMKLLNKFAKCQNLSIWQQIQKGVTMFDIRIRPHTLEVAHGLVEYNCNVRDVFDTLETYA